jgi:hypothetical protein
MWLPSILLRSKSQRLPPARKAYRRLFVEPLEDRTLPSFLVSALPVGANPQAVAVGDFTGTGISDLVVANHDSGTVSVFRGKGDGTFGASQNYAVDGTPVSIMVGDFNKDGKLDIVTANDNNGTVSVLLGNGNGTFQPALNYVLPAQATGAQTLRSLAVGDFNKDGKLDLAVTANTYTPGTPGSWSPGYHNGYNPPYYIPGTPAQYNGYVNVLIGNGAGGFSSDNSSALPNSIPGSVAVGDFAGNGNLDLAIAEPSLNTVSVLPGNGNGTFNPAQNHDVGGTPVSMAVGDLNNDGKLDIITANDSNGTVSVLLSNGNGTFQPALNYALPAQASGSQTLRSLAVGDFNKDGKLDLAVTGNTYTPGTPGTPGFTNGYTYYPGTPGTPAQYNGYVNVLIGNGAGGFFTDHSYALPGGIPGYSYAVTSGIPGSVAAGDFNRDGWPDLAVVNPSANTASVLLNAGDWSPEPQASSFVVSGFPSPTTAGTAASFTITAKNANGTMATSYTGTVHFTSSDPQAVLPADYTFTATDAGVHTFSSVLKTAGTQSVTATDTFTASLTGTDGGITISPAAASAFSVAGFASPCTAGVAGTFTVTALDAYGNRTGYLGTVHFTSSDPQGVLPASYTFTPADAGMHTFSATLKTAGSYYGQSLTATDTTTAGITGTQAGITVNPGAAITFVFSPDVTPWPLGQPAPGYTAGQAWTFEVVAMDAYGNRANGYTGTVHFTSSDKQAVLPANHTFTARDAGDYPFSVTFKTAGTQSITVTDTATASITGTDAGLVVFASAASQFIISAPVSVHAAASFSLTLTVEDAYGNIITNYTGTVHFSSTDAGGRLPSNYTFAAADKGVHKFTGLVLRTRGNQKITITDAHNSLLKVSVIVDVL